MLEIGHLFFDKKFFTNPIFCDIIIKLAQLVHNNRGGGYKWIGIHAAISGYPLSSA